MRKTLCTIVLCCVIAFGVLGTPVWISSTLWDQDALKYVPSGPGYPVLAVTELIDGDTFEALLHIAPQLIIAVDIRVDGVDTPELGRHGGKCPTEAEWVRELVTQFLAEAGEIRVKLTGYNFGRWVCIVTVNGVDLAEWIKEKKLTKGDRCPEELKSSPSEPRDSTRRHPPWAE